jgi:hypothetical protein
MELPQTALNRPELGTMVVNMVVNMGRSFPLLSRSGDGCGERPVTPVC